MFNDKDFSFFTKNAQKDKRARQIQDQIIQERNIDMKNVSVDVLHEIIREAEQKANKENG
jgi:hypothetical protein